MAESSQNDITKSNPAASGEYDKKCIFCKIVNKEMGTELLHCDEEISCFKDIRPAAPHHYLVVPNKHVGNCKSLTKEKGHVGQLKHSGNIFGGILIFRSKVDTFTYVICRFGFHWPPFCSVTHLHLHVLAPVSQMGYMSRLIYKLNSYWFITADQLIEMLNSKEETN
uniref:Adenosine 5'-monophosphoramidase HINT3 n=1 Tax=Periophthalmus magnuspinnatus TaxID=409849 RepID=A0A3B4BDH4_9GOBI